MSLLRAREVVVLQFRPILRRFELNDQQWRVLRVLAEVKEITASQLALHSAVLSPSLSRMLPSMESRELIRRSSGKTDQRHCVIRMEPPGRALFERVTADFEFIYVYMAKSFGAERLNSLHKELEALRKALSTS
jgi:homoprotocatechuate degradation regulator HpaR